MIGKLKLNSIFLVLLISVLPSCASLPYAKIKSYPPMSANKSLQIICNRQALAKSITGKGLLTLLDKNGNSIRLDSVFVLKPSNSARVRAWKLNHTVFDLTLNPKGLWILIPDKSDKTKKLKKISSQIAKGIKVCVKMLSGSMGNEIESKINSKKIIITWDIDNKNKLIGYINRKTLTFNNCVIINANHKQIFKIDFSNYRSIKVSENKNKSIVWPMQMEFYSRLGKFKVNLNSINLNIAPESAFKPPRQAKKLD